MPQINEEFAPRPEYSAFTNSPFIGVHKTSPIQPNADNKVSQKKGVMDWLNEIREHKFFPFGLALLGLIFLVLFIVRKTRTKTFG